MTVAQTIEADWAGLAKFLRDTPLVYQKEQARILVGASLVLAGEMASSAMQLLNKDPTGDLARSHRGQLVEDDGRVAMAMAGTDLPYAEVQNNGDPQHGIGGLKKMSVPLSFAGVPRGKAPSDFPTGALALIKRKGKDSLLADVSSKGKMKPLYVLKDFVSIKGTYYREAAAESGEPKVTDYVANEIDKVTTERIGEWPEE